MPGNPDSERRIKSLVRWNAAAMVVRANKAEDGIGGHISTYASAATLYEVGFNHFFRGHDGEDDGDLVFFQGHAAPGIYARAYLEGRIDETHLENFRRELKPGGGLSSYPHPWLMPDFWDYPSVSMGLSPIMAIYHARFIRTWRTAVSSRGRAARSGRFSATVKPTSPKRLAPSRFRRAKSSTI
jgi:pyruvate dehydrogenase E1 component